MELDLAQAEQLGGGFADELVGRWAEAEAGAVRAEDAGDHELADALRARADDLRRLATQHELSLPGPRTGAGCPSGDQPDAA